MVNFVDILAQTVTVLGSVRVYRNRSVLSNIRLKMIWRNLELVTIKIPEAADREDGKEECGDQAQAVS